MKRVARILAVGCGGMIVGCAAPPPVTLAPSYAERNPARVHTAAAPPARCLLQVDEVTDTRQDPTILGVVLNRAVRAPTDTAAWIRSVLTGLSSRGVGPAFDAAGAGIAPDALHAKFELRTAWVTDVASNKTANIVIHARLERGGETLLDRNFRGSRSTTDWSASESELRNLVDEAFGKALDQLAVEIRPLCAERP